MKRVVFISHSSADLPVAERLCAYLEKNSVPCWIAPRDVTPGKNYGAAIVDAIDECRVFVLLLSSQSNKSRQVVREVERAASSDSVILPFRIENVQPSRDLAFYVSAAHWLDATKQPVDDQFGALLAAIRGWQQPESTEGKETATPTSPAPLPVLPPVPEATPQPRSRMIILVAAGIAAAIAVGGLVFYKLQPAREGPGSGARLAPTASPMETPAPTVAPSPTATSAPSLSPTETETPTATPSPTPSPSPIATPIRLKPGERLRPNATPEFMTAPPTAADLPPPPPTTAAPLNTTVSPSSQKRPIVREVAASSSLDNQHRPNYAFDGDPATGWVTKGTAAKQTLFAHFKSPALVSSVTILNGDGRDEKRYRAASRIKTLRILLSDGTNQLLTFKDEMKRQTFELKKPVTATWVKFEIVSVYSGETKQGGLFEIGFNEANEL